MGFVQRIIHAIRGGEPQNAGVAFTSEFENALRSRAGGTLDWQVAIQVSTVLRCAVIRAEEICSIPWKIYQDIDGEKVEARDHPLWDVMHSSPNDWQTSFEFRSTIGMHLALAGNAYVWLNRVRGRIVEMIPFEPSMVQVCRKDDWSIEYRVTMLDGRQLVFQQGDIWHLRNHSWDSYRGLAALSYAKKAIDLAREIETSQTDIHKNFAKPSGVLAVDREMDHEQFKETRKLIDAQVGSRLSKGLPMVVDKTMTWTQMALKAIDQQTVENRGFQIEEIGRGMGVLPIMLGHSGDKSITYASAEQMFIHQFVHNIRPRHRSFEQSGDKWLLSRRDRKDGYYTGLVDQELLRGDTKARGEFYRLLWMIGSITGNEVRSFEDMNRLEGLDRPWAPLANAPIGEDGMPMIADDRTDIDKALQNKEALNLLGEAYRAASPIAQQKFMDHLRGDPDPTEVSD